MIHGYRDTLIQGYTDAGIQGYRDYRDTGMQGLQGCRDAHIHGCMDTWIHGYMDAGIHGCRDTWIQGYMDTGIHRYMDAGMQGCRDTGIQGYRKEWKKFLKDENYHKYFMTPEKKFSDKLLIVKNYCDENNKLTIKKSEDKDVKKLGLWVIAQKQNFANNKYNMENQAIRKMWENFVKDEKYEKYFMAPEKKFSNKLLVVKKYCDENKKLPSQSSKKEDVKKLGNWVNGCHI